MPHEKRLLNELTVVGDLVSISDIIERGKSEIITVRIKQPGQYENNLDIEFFNDRIDEVLEYEDFIGSRMRIRASVNGRLWRPKVEGTDVPDTTKEERLFLGITGWSIKLDEEPVKTKEGSKRAARKKASSDDGMPGESMPGEEAGSTEPEDGAPKKRTRSKKADAPAVEEAPTDNMPF